jgi:hypothetical protein
MENGFCLDATKFLIENYNQISSYLVYFWSIYFVTTVGHIIKKKIYIYPHPRSLNDRSRTPDTSYQYMMWCKYSFCYITANYAVKF